MNSTARTSNGPLKVPRLGDQLCDTVSGHSCRSVPLGSVSDTCLSTCLHPTATPPPPSARNHQRSKSQLQKLQSSQSRLCSSCLGRTRQALKHLGTAAGSDLCCRVHQQPQPSAVSPFSPLVSVKSEQIHCILVLKMESAHS